VVSVLISSTFYYLNTTAKTNGQSICCSLPQAVFQIAVVHQYRILFQITIPVATFVRKLPRNGLVNEYL